MRQGRERPRVAHRRERRADCGGDLAEGGDAAEEPQDPEGPGQPEKRQSAAAVGRHVRRHRRRHHRRVEPAPPAAAAADGLGSAGEREGEARGAHLHIAYVS